MVKRRIVFAYVVLIGLPLIAVTGVIEAGRHLQAPVCVRGAWELELDNESIRSPAWSCLFYPSVERPYLELTQAGPNVTIRLPNKHTTIAAQLNGRNLMGTGEVPRNLLVVNRLSLAAVVQNQGTSRILVGSLSQHGDRVSENTVQFRAVWRQNTSSRIAAY